MYIGGYYSEMREEYSDEGIFHELTDRLTEREKKIIQMIGDAESPLSPYDITKKMDVSYATVFRNCKELENEDLLVVNYIEGSKKTQKNEYDLSVTGFCCYIQLICILDYDDDGNRISYERYELPDEFIAKIFTTLRKYKNLSWEFDYMLFFLSKIPSNKIIFRTVVIGYFIQGCADAIKHQSIATKSSLDFAFVKRPLYPPSSRKRKTLSGHQFYEEYESWWLDFVLNVIKEYSDKYTGGKLLSLVKRSPPVDLMEMESDIFLASRLLDETIFKTWIQVICKKYQ